MVLRKILWFRFGWCNLFLMLSLNSYDSNLRKLVFQKITIDGVEVKFNFGTSMRRSSGRRVRLSILFYCIKKKTKAIKLDTSVFIPGTPRM